jgi:hypothetical protein
MLRMVLVGLLIPLGVGVLAAMELRTPPRTAVAVVRPLAETTVGISDSHGALAKADRLEITHAKSETPTQPRLADERISPSGATPSVRRRARGLSITIGTIPKQRRSQPLPPVRRRG